MSQTINPFRIVNRREHQHTSVVQLFHCYQLIEVATRMEQVQDERDSQN